MSNNTDDKQQSDNVLEKLTTFPDEITDKFLISYLKSLTTNLKNHNSIIYSDNNFSDIFENIGIIFKSYMENNKVNKKICNALITSISNTKQIIISIDKDLLIILLDVFKSNTTLITDKNFTSIFTHLQYHNKNVNDILKIFKSNNIFIEDDYYKYLINFVMNNTQLQKYITDNIIISNDILNLYLTHVIRCIKNPKQTKTTIHNMVFSTSWLLTEISKNKKIKIDNTIIKLYIDVVRLNLNEYNNSNTIEQTLTTLLTTKNINYLEILNEIIKIEKINTSRVIMDTLINNKLIPDDELIEQIFCKISDYREISNHHDITTLSTILFTNKIKCTEKQMIKVLVHSTKVNRYYESSIFEKIVINYIINGGELTSELFKNSCKYVNIIEAMLAHNYIPTDEDINYCVKNGHINSVKKIQSQFTIKSSISNAIQDKNEQEIKIAIENNMIPTIDEFRQIFSIVKCPPIIEKLKQQNFTVNIECLRNACTISGNSHMIHYIISNHGIEPDNICANNICNTTDNQTVIHHMVKNGIHFTIQNLLDANKNYRNKHVLSRIIDVLIY